MSFDVIGQGYIFNVLLVIMIIRRSSSTAQK
jgi:hypothetical protein